MGVVKAPVCNLPLLYTPCPCAVPIIPLLGISLTGFASGHVVEWFHIRTEKLCYQSQLFTLQRISRAVYIKGWYPCIWHGRRSTLVQQIKQDEVYLS